MDHLTFRFGGKIISYFKCILSKKFYPLNKIYEVYKIYITWFLEGNFRFLYHNRQGSDNFDKGKIKFLL